MALSLRCGSVVWATVADYRLYSFNPPWTVDCTNFPIWPISLRVLLILGSITMVLQVEKHTLWPPGPGAKGVRYHDHGELHYEPRSDR